MSGICGIVGYADGAEEIISAMLQAIEYRGDSVDKWISHDACLGYRWWKDRPGKSNAIFQDNDYVVAASGTLAPPSQNPAKTLADLIPKGLTLDLDGAFACALWDKRRRILSLVRDPFGVRSLYYVIHKNALFFASELKQILAIPGIPVEIDHVAVHKYLTFSFVSGEAVPIKGIRRILPGHIAQISLDTLTVSSSPYVVLKEQIDHQFDERKSAVIAVREQCQQAVKHRLNGEGRVGLFLSGGLDSSGVGAWLKEFGANVEAFSLDFGKHSVEKPQAEAVAKHLGIPLSFVRVQGEDVAAAFEDLIWKMDLPFGDPVTGPQFLLGKAARDAGMSAIFNGEGGDQLFGGWTNKPMIAASLYANLYEETSWEELYLQSYHRFYGREDQLYTDDMRSKVGSPGQRRAVLQPYLSGGDATSFLGRMRLADIALKGSQNILPRMERMANAWGLDARVPLFDRRLAELAFRLPPSMKLNANVEKYVLKHALKKVLPQQVVWQKKLGMGVPITDWVLGGLAPLLAHLLGKVSMTRRGLFQSNYVGGLLRGEPEASEVRRRRIGEKVWALAVLEGWMRIFIDGKGQRPAKGVFER